MSTTGGPVSGALAQLRGWLAGALDAPVGIPVEVAPPGAGDRTRVCVWPLALLPGEDTRGGTGREPLRLRVRHLVTVDGPGEAALEVLDRVLAAAARDDGYPVGFEPPAPQTWAAFGAVPRPALLVDVPVQVARDLPATARVRHPLHLDAVPLHTVAGRVVGPGGVPLSGIKVTATGGGSTAYTDGDGGFVLAGLPGAAPALLHLSGRGLYLQARVEPAGPDPILIHCDLEEA